MRLLKYMIIVLKLSYCQASNSSESTDVQVEAGGNHTVGGMPEEFRGDPHVDHTGCRWTLRLPGNRSRDAVPLSPDSAGLLAEQICQELDCGRVYRVDESRAPPNATCFHDCWYAAQRLQNCSRSVRSDCTVITAAVCGHRAVWLAGGPDRCAGRVEVWRDGRRGTVCDDGWDLRDAHVVCAQLGCGYALSVTGQGSSSFPPGRGPVLMDELNCSGHEENLWACPASGEEPDCGHKEDAGVICSEMRAIRLTGGVDHCSGKLEVHRNGSWGTVCDHCWNEHLASVVCSMLQCGSTPLHFSQFVPPLAHNRGPLWYYQCDPAHQSLWQCRELVNRTNLCVESKASGVVCEGSLGFLTVNTTHGTPVDESLTTVSAGTRREAPFPELLLLLTVCLLLLVLLITNTVFCCHYRRRHALLLQQTRSSPPARLLNNYHESVHLVKVTANSHEQTHVPTDPRYLWTQRSSVDSTAVDSDYEQCDLSNDPSFPLSTFRNSRRYRNDSNPSQGPSGAGAGGVWRDGPEPRHRETPAPGGGPHDAHDARASTITQDSFETSSTSSGDDYENSGYVTVTADPGPGAVDPPSFPLNNHPHPSAQTSNMSSSDEDDGPLYSPVSPD